MSVGHKSSNTQIFRLMVYRRALHPELFDLQSRKIYRHGEYEAEGWVIPGGHVVRFQVGGESITETVVENGDHLPETGLVHALPCLGEKDYEMARDQGRLSYVTTIQTESLTDNLYQATYREMRDFSRQVEAQSYEWTDPEGTPCMSILDCQKFKKQFHIQSYHLMGISGMVLRTQSIFEAH